VFSDDLALLPDHDVEDVQVLIACGLDESF
jgi:hypothetical protein